VKQVIENPTAALIGVNCMWTTFTFVTRSRHLPCQGRLWAQYPLPPLKGEVAPRCRRGWL